MLKIAIIGTAGRKSDHYGLHASDFSRMCNLAERIVTAIASESYIVSGGAAWADHVAVNLKLRGVTKYLALHLPAEFDLVSKRYVDDSAGRISNHYHGKFSSKVGIKSLEQIAEVIPQSNCTVGKGFHDRNNKVANVDAVIAFTFGKGNCLKDGGTAHTFGQYLKHTKKNISFHIDLNDWKVYNPAILS